MISIKKILNHFLIIFLISFFSIDFILSNTLLNLTKKSCYQIERFYLELKKNCIGKEKFKSGFPVVNIYTDNQGLRVKKNHERTDKNKIFILGSSMTFGTGLEYNESAIGILEKQQPKYEFYNFSTGSYSPTAYLYQLKKQFKNNHIPEKTILFLSLADIFNEGVVWAGYDKDNRPLLSSDTIYKINEQKINEKFIKKNFRVSRSLVHSINSKMRVIRNKAQTKIKNNYKIKSSFQGGFTYRPISELKPFYTDEIFFNGKKKLNNRVNEISKILNKNNVEFYLAIYPFAENLEYGQKIFDWEEYTKDLCAKINNCNFVNTFGAFKEYRFNNKNWYSDLFFIGDEHYTNEGHKLFANNLNQNIFN